VVLQQKFPQFSKTEENLLGYYSDAAWKKTSRRRSPNVIANEWTEGMRLSGKVTIVTGASLGLGRAVTTRFAREGASVVAADVNETDGTELVAQLKSEGLKAIFVRTDVSQQSAVKALYDATFSQFGKVDVLYSNAAVLLPGRDLPIHEISVETFDHVMNVNLRGAFLCAKYAVSSMLQNGGGSVIFVGSPTGLVGCAPALTAYSTSKAAIIGLTRVMAPAHGRDNIRVNAIVPGTMDTPMNSYILTDPAVRDKYRDAVPSAGSALPTTSKGLLCF
jgi:NAD(P)-dependent dehydrogenase (short-subunit alcohol dehydrogenase family)